LGYILHLFSKSRGMIAHAHRARSSLIIAGGKTLRPMQDGACVCAYQWTSRPHFGATNASYNQVEALYQADKSAAVEVRESTKANSVICSPMISLRGCRQLSPYAGNVQLKRGPYRSVLVKSTVPPRCSGTFCAGAALITTMYPTKLIPNMHLRVPNYTF
jgi:hypothetical protein